MEWLTVLLSLIAGLGGGILATWASIQGTRRQRLEDAYSNLARTLTSLTMSAPTFATGGAGTPQDLVALVSAYSAAEATVSLQERNKQCTAEVEKMGDLVREVMECIMRSDSPDVVTEVTTFGPRIQQQLQKILYLVRDSHHGWF